MATSAPESASTRKELDLFISLLLILCYLVAILAGAFNASAILPPAAPVDADGFSGARAYDFLAEIAKEPHPWYSQDNERVFEFILSHGNALVEQYGTDVIETSLQNVTQYDPVGYNAYSNSWVNGSMINIAYLIKGKITGKEANAIQVSAHYDGVPMGPSASDDGAGCAIMMELASVLASRSASGQMLERDVLILFVDAEEDGLLGAQFWASGVDDLGNDISHPWSKLPSFAINMEGSGTATSGAMLIRSNSKFATEAYQKFAPYPKAFSLTEWIYKTISIGYTDSDVYWTQGIHLMDLIWVENRWAYHSQDDSIENVKSSSLQSCGENVLSIVVGSAASPDFPSRIPYEELISNEVIQSGGSVGMGSGTVYYSLMGGTMVLMSFDFARGVYIVVALVLGLSMPVLVGDSHHSSHLPQKCKFCSKNFAKVSFRQALIVLLNFLLGLVMSVVVFAAFGVWKSPSEEQFSRRNPGYWDDDNDVDSGITAWGGIGVARSFLSLFTVCGTTFIVYMPLRAGLCCFKRPSVAVRGTSQEGTNLESFDERKPLGDPSHADDVAEDDAKEEEVTDQHLEGGEAAMIANMTAEVEKENTEEVDVEQASVEQQEQLAKISKNAFVGVFYFYDVLLLILGAAMADAACLILWQPICMWFASLADALFRRWMRQNQEQAERSRLIHALISVFPALLLLPTGVYILINVFGYFMDDLGYWYGAPLVDSFCFGLIIPIFTPVWLPIGRRGFTLLCITCCLCWIFSAVSCMVISG